MCRWVHKNLPASSIFYSPTKYPTTPTHIHQWPSNPRRKPSYKRIGKGSCGVEGSDVRPEPSWGLVWEPHRSLPKPDAGNHQQTLAGFCGMLESYAMSKMREQPSCAAKQRSAHSTCPGSGLPGCLSHCPGSSWPSCCLHCSSGRGILPTFFFF